MKKFVPKRQPQKKNFYNPDLENKISFRKNFKINYKLVKFHSVNGEVFFVRSCIKNPEYSLTVDNSIWTQKSKRKSVAGTKKMFKNFEERFGKT